MTHSTHAMNQDEDTYTLATGTRGAKRLDTQNKMLSEASYAHLEKAGLSEGQIIWDLGCGNGSMTVYLAQQVGPSGKVYAIDISEEQLSLAKDKIKSAALSNVAFFKGDIRTQQDLPIGVADLVYMRLVLMHVKDPEKLIHVAKNLLKDGGVVVSQESIMSTSYSSSDNKVFHECKETLLAMAEKLGVDYNIGNRLEQLYKQAGFISTNMHEIQPKVDSATIKEIFSLSLAEWKARAIALGVLTEDKAKNWEEVIANWPDDGTNFFCAPPKQAYVIAKKEK